MSNNETRSLLFSKMSDELEVKKGERKGKKVVGDDKKGHVNEWTRIGEVVCFDFALSPCYLHWWWWTFILFYILPDTYYFVG